MVRSVRVEYKGASYHVMARGNEGKLIYRHADDYKRFLFTLMQMVRLHGITLEAYCLMPNHYHLAITTPGGNLSQAMGWLQTTYTVRFNKRHKRKGHLFQGRYQAHIVGSADYAKELVKYIHLNPVRPKNKKDKIPVWKRKYLNQYQWSSHVYYSGTKKAESWLEMNWLNVWGKNKRQAMLAYKREIAECFGMPPPSLWEKLKGGLVLGNQDEYDKVKKIIEEQKQFDSLQWSAKARQQQVQNDLESIISQEEDEYVQIWLRVRLGGERMTVMGRELGYRDGSGIHQVIKRLEVRAQKDKLLRAKLRKYSNLSSVKD